jgi:hypothetical protein
MQTLKEVQPYHQFGARRHSGVYHDRTDCPAGQLIHSQDLAGGGKGLRLCEQCRGLDEQAAERSAR